MTLFDQGAVTVQRRDDGVINKCHRINYGINQGDEKCQIMKILWGKSDTAFVDCGGGGIEFKKSKRIPGFLIGISGRMMSPPTEESCGKSILVWKLEIRKAQYSEN